MFLFMHGQTTTNYTMGEGNSCYFKENPQCIQDKSNIYIGLHTRKPCEYILSCYVHYCCLMRMVLMMVVVVVGDEMKIACQP